MDNTNKLYLYDITLMKLLSTDAIQGALAKFLEELLYEELKKRYPDLDIQQMKNFRCQINSIDYHYEKSLSQFNFGVFDDKTVSGFQKTTFSLQITEFLEETKREVEPIIPGIEEKDIPF